MDRFRMDKNDNFDGIELPKKKSELVKNTSDEDFSLPKVKSSIEETKYLKVPDIPEEKVVVRKPISQEVLIEKKAIIKKSEFENTKKVEIDQDLENLKKLNLSLEIEVKKRRELQALKDLQEKLQGNVNELPEEEEIEFLEPLDINIVTSRELEVPEVVGADSEKVLETSKIKPQKRRKPKPAFYALLTISLLLVVFSGYNIFTWYLDNLALNKQIEEITVSTRVEEVDGDAENVELINEPAVSNPDNDYWNFINMPLINVDFTELLNKNSDTVGFIKVNGTNINYPIVQTTDNDYYLTHSFDKKYNGAGWVFLDYRNDLENLQDNTIVYAHARKDRTMFGSLRYALNKDWFSNKDNYIINLSTPLENTQWQIISVYTIPTETYYLISEFGTEESHQKYLDTILSRSVHKFNTEVSTNDKLLTLSTCYTGDNKMVVHAKLIKRQVR